METKLDSFDKFAIYLAFLGAVVRSVGISLDKGDVLSWVLTCCLIYLIFRVSYKVYNLK